MPTYTRAQLKTQILTETGYVGSNVIDTTALETVLDQFTAELYDMLVAANGEMYYATTSNNLVVASSGGTITPPTFYRIHKLQYLNGSQWMRVPSCEFTEVETTYQRSWYLVGTTIYLAPDSAAPGTYRLWYTPRFAGYVNDAGTFDGVSGWERYVVCRCCMWVKAQYTEDDGGPWAAELGLLKERIENMRGNRNAAGPRKWKQLRKRRYDDYIPGDEVLP